MPVVSPVAAAACAPMEIEALPRSPGGEKRRLVPGLETVPCLTVYLFVVLFSSFFKLSFHQIFFEMHSNPGEDKHFRKWMAVSKFNASSFVKYQCQLATAQCSLPMKERLGWPTDPCWVLKEVGGYLGVFLMV